jgi:uroporphyrin-3 C-methyltransferase
MLEEAEMAVLRGNQPLYERALSKARTTIETWYDASNPRVTALGNTLAELARNNVDPELPDISQSLSLLKERLAGRLNANNSNDGNNTGGGSGGKGGDDS